MTTEEITELYCISTHSLTRRLTFVICSFYASINISTHSLTRRLTGHFGVISAFLVISTHSLTRRLTRDGYWTEITVPFQLTASQGG